MQGREVAEDRHTLRVERNRRTDVEKVAGHYDQVELRCGSDDPVELGQGVVKIGDEEDAHGIGGRVVSARVRAALLFHRPEAER